MKQYSFFSASGEKHHTNITSQFDTKTLEDKNVQRRSTLNLVKELCNALDEEGILYCHWKSNNMLERSASGENDLDLLVNRADVSRFTQILYRLRFKQVEAPASKRMPGVLDYFGYDEEADRLVHVHAHYQLIIGHDMTKNYHLPIEKQYLESTTQDDLFKVPAPEFEFIIFVIRMALKHLTWDVILIGEGGLKTAERKELTYLQARIYRGRVGEILKQHLPYINVELFDNCIQALQPTCSAWMRVRTGNQLQTRLQANTRRILPIDTYLKLWRRGALAIHWRIFKAKPKHLLKSGGTMIAIIGGDGTGKTTAVDSLYPWLSKDIETMKVHLGKPTWSWTTKIVRGTLSLGRMFGIYPHLNSSILYTHNSKSPKFRGRIPWMLREICKARDRYLTYVKARRFSINGGLVICDRYPLPQIKLMDGAIIEQVINRDKTGRICKFLMTLERRYYLPITLPDLVIVLRLNPETAVLRKIEESADEVRIRSTEIWEIDWRQTQAHVIDSHQTRAEVLSDLKSLIWSEL